MSRYVKLVELGVSVSAMGSLMGNVLRATDLDERRLADDNMIPQG